MAIASAPYTIRVIYTQLHDGGRSALASTGADHFLFKCDEEEERECRPVFDSFVTGKGAIAYDVGLQFSVNGKRGEGWKMVVTYERNDTYTVYLWRKPDGSDPGEAGLFGVVIEKCAGVYGDNLAEIVEDMYDRAIESRAGGLIPFDCEGCEE